MIMKSNHLNSVGITTGVPSPTTHWPKLLASLLHPRAPGHPPHPAPFSWPHNSSTITIAGTRCVHYTTLPRQKSVKRFRK